MKTVTIHLTSIDDIKTFIHKSSAKNYDIDLRSGRYLIDAKSIMGIFSLDLTKPITVEIHAEDGECEEYIREISQFLCKE